jgi:hypothetical protein
MNACAGACNVALDPSDIAIFEHAGGHWECLFLGVHRKSLAHGQNDANDPKATFAARDTSMK